MTEQVRTILVFVQTNEPYKELKKIARIYVNRFAICASDEFEIKVYYINHENPIKSGLIPIFNCYNAM